jgi:hypothetical protein
MYFGRKIGLLTFRRNMVSPPSVQNIEAAESFRMFDVIIKLLDVTFRDVIIPSLRHHFK